MLVPVFLDPSSTRMVDKDVRKYDEGGLLIVRPHRQLVLKPVISTGASYGDVGGLRLSLIQVLFAGLAISAAVGGLVVLLYTMASHDSKPYSLSPPPYFPSKPPSPPPSPTPPQSPPPPLAPIFTGCTYSIAVNYDPSANTDDGNCFIPGCMNSLARNYDSVATVDDGTCIFTRIQTFSRILGYMSPCQAFIDTNEDGVFDPSVELETTTNTIGYSEMTYLQPEEYKIVRVQADATRQCEDSIASVSSMTSFSITFGIDFTNVYLHTAADDPEFDIRMTTIFTTLAVGMQRAGYTSSLLAASSLVCERAIPCVPCGISSTLQSCVESTGCIDVCTLYGSALNVFQFDDLRQFLLADVPDTAWLAWMLGAYVIGATVVCAQDVLGAGVETTDVVYDVLERRIHDDRKFDLCIYNGSDVRAVILEAATQMGQLPNPDAVDAATASCASRNTNVYLQWIGAFHPSHPNASSPSQNTQTTRRSPSNVYGTSVLQRLQTIFPGFPAGSLGCGNATATNFLSSAVFYDESLCVF